MYKTLLIGQIINRVLWIGVVIMSLITCSSDCLYQENGYCNLNYAAAIGVPSETGCIHYIPKQMLKYGDMKKRKNKQCVPNDESQA